METIESILRKIQPLDTEELERTQDRLDRLTKPPGSLGRMEEIAMWVVRVNGKIPPLPLKKGLFVFAADHGVVEEQVSAYPKSVTARMVYTFLGGGAAINVLARHAGAALQIIDVGVDHDFKKVPGLVHRKISRGTRNMRSGPAMSRSEAERSVFIGYETAKWASLQGINLIGVGEMGIGNTTAGSAVTAAMTGVPAAQVTGTGTGIGGGGLLHKQRVVQEAIEKNRPDFKDPLDVLAKVGGFEIGAMAGLILGAAAHRIPLVLDGFITASSALLAAALKPETKDFLLAGHRSTEPGHRIALNALGIESVLALKMRLGEGTGAALVMGIVEASLKLLNEMATFEEAGIARGDATV